MTGLSVDADIAADLSLLGKYVADLQEDIEFGKYGISGTLKYVTGYTGFSGDVSEQSGNYLALHFAVADHDDATITVKLTKGKHGEQTLDPSDNICIFRIEDAAQEIIVTATVTGYRPTTIRVPIHGLVLEEE